MLAKSIIILTLEIIIIFVYMFGTSYKCKAVINCCVQTNNQIKQVKLPVNENILLSMIDNLLYKLKLNIWQ